ncbi:necdin-like 2 isoform X3 [Osmerus eperlanus]|uniref:necdin-like 2 isoform X3 n=1 Tax=Osmerus eperlanus TaxID=29151 RepID=UPI002E138275
MSQRRKVSHGLQSSFQTKTAQRSETLLGDDEDEEGTQPSSSQVQRGLDRLTPAQVDLKMSEVVQFFLVKDQKKMPIRRADIVKHVLKEYRNIYPEIMKRVERTLEQVFGLKVVEMDTKNHVYMLINKLETVEGAAFSVREKHEEFGDVKKMVTDEFVRQRYLEYVRVPHTEPVEFEFRWGQRADIEVSKVKLLEFMGQLHDQDPKSWSQQYRDATSPMPGTSSQRQSSQR